MFIILVDVLVNYATSNSTTATSSLRRATICLRHTLRISTKITRSRTSSKAISFVTF